MLSRCLVRFFCRIVGVANPDTTRITTLWPVLILFIRTQWASTYHIARIDLRLMHKEVTQCRLPREGIKALRFEIINTARFQETRVVPSLASRDYGFTPGPWSSIDRGEVVKLMPLGG